MDISSKNVDLDNDILIGLLTMKVIRVDDSHDSLCINGCYER